MGTGMPTEFVVYRGMEMEKKDRKNKDGKNKGYFVVEWLADGQARIMYADSGACMLTGMSVEELLLSDPVQAAKSLDMETIRLDDEHELWILDTLHNRRQRLAELEKMNAALEDALNAAEAANRAKSNFLSNMSHDIRTPMNAILGMTSIGLSHIDEKPRVLDCLHKIQTASTHLMSLVNDVLDMSRIDSGRLTLNEEVFSLADSVHDIAVIVRPQAEQKNQSLLMEIGQIYEENLIGDALRLRQIMVNIINNAVKYTQEGGSIHVCIGQRTEGLTGEREKDLVWLDFLCEDNGIGMSKEFLEKIFLPFERVSNTTTSKIEGTGLGMAIVKNIIDRMGGVIHVESREGEGSRFRVEIPMTIASKSRTAPNLPKGQTVLITESRDARAEQIAGYLEEEGLVPVRVNTGLEAVTWLTEAQCEDRMPCAMLLGQELDDMSVLDLAAHVRGLAGQAFPILLVSEEDWAEMEYRATRAGVNAFVPCPLFKSRLLESLCGLMGISRKEEEEKEGVDADFARMRVLLVEDNALNQEIAMELLSLIGVQVEVAENGARAVELFEAAEEGHFDLILMDIQMPVMNGYEATKRIRRMQRKDAQTIWIVAMTANAFVEDIRLSREAGMNEHCSKPVDPERLQEILRSRLKNEADAV